MKLEKQKLIEFKKTNKKVKGREKVEVIMEENNSLENNKLVTEEN